MNKITKWLQLFKEKRSFKLIEESERLRYVEKALALEKENTNFRDEELGKIKKLLFRHEEMFKQIISKDDARSLEYAEIKNFTNSHTHYWKGLVLDRITDLNSEIIFLKNSLISMLNQIEILADKVLKLESPKKKPLSKKKEKKINHG